MVPTGNSPPMVLGVSCAQAGLELHKELRLPLNFWPSYFSLLSGRMTGMCRHTQLNVGFKFTATIFIYQGQKFPSSFILRVFLVPIVCISPGWKTLGLYTLVLFFPLSYYVASIVSESNSFQFYQPAVPWSCSSSVSALNPSFVLESQLFYCSKYSLPRLCLTHGKGLKNYCYFIVAFTPASQFTMGKLL